jgi:hypothetical protein
MEEPKWKKSTIEVRPPKTLLERTERAEPQPTWLSKDTVPARRACARIEKEEPMWTRSRTLMEPPGWHLPATETLLPKRAKLRMLIELPIVKKSITESPPPNLALLPPRTESELPISTCSITDIRSTLPTAHLPITETLEPTRVKQRMLTELPRVRKSRMLARLPNRAVLLTETALPRRIVSTRDIAFASNEPLALIVLPKRQKERTDNEEPSVNTSQHDILKWVFTEPRTERLEARCTLFRTDIAPITRAHPATETPLARRDADRIETDEPMLRKSRREALLPILPVPRTLNEELICRKSSALTRPLDRAKRRIENELPRCTAAAKLTEAPAKRVVPKTEQEEPNFWAPRREREEPSTRLSSNENFPPVLTAERTDRVDPMWT